jgi:GntR family transcriptional regulator
MLLKESSVPLHIQLADAVRGRIKRRELLPNDRIPSERELCARYEISRITVRKALSTLIQEGLILAVSGKGTYVAETPLREELSPLSSFTQDLERRGMQASSKVLDLSVIPATGELAARLHIPRGAELVRLERLRLADGLPIAVQLTYLPHHLCPDLHHSNFAQHSLYAVLRERYGLRLVRSDTIISAALAQADEIALLNLKKPSAVLISEQTTYLDTNEVIEVTRSVFHAERYKLYTHSLSGQEEKQQ